MSAGSAIEISGPALLAPWSARDVHHGLTPVRRGTPWRDQDGGLHLSRLPGEKYALRLNGGDVRPPALEGQWPGTILTVVPAQELAVLLEPGTDTVTLGRDPAAGSVRAESAAARSHSVAAVSGRTVTVAPHAEGPVSVHYRPRLTMMVTAWETELAEWEGQAPWRLELEEV